MLLDSLLFHLEVDSAALLALRVRSFLTVLNFGEDRLLFYSTQLQLTIVVGLEF